MTNSWTFGWDALGVIASSVLAIILMFFTIRIAKQQNKIQKEISDRDVRLQNYQHRAKCYLQIIEASAIMAKAHALNITNILQDLPISAQEVNNLYHGCHFMLKTQLEAKLLFSPRLATLIYEMFDNYSEYVQQTTELTFLHPQSINKFIKNIDLINLF